MQEVDSVIVKDVPVKILFAVLDRREQTVSDISSQVDTPTPYVSEILDGLEDEGYVESRKSEKDGRKRIYSVTEQGVEFLDFLNQAYAEA